MNNLYKLKKAFVEAVLEKLLIENATGQAKQFGINIPEEFNMLVSLDPTYDSSKDDGVFINWIFKLYNRFKANEKAEKKYQKAVEYKKEHPEAALPPKPEQLSQDKLEDFEKIKDLLNTLKDRVNLKTFDTNQFKSVADLAAYVRGIEEKDIPVDKKAEDKYKVFRAAVDDGLVVVYNGPNFIIGVPTTYEASSHFKKPITNWCTAYPEMYDRYLQEYGGKYYIHLNKHTGDLYQLHYESDQFKDASDREIDKIEFIKQYPELKAFYNKLIDGIQIEDKDFQIVINNKIMEDDPFWWLLFDKHVPSDKKNIVNALENLNDASEDLQIKVVTKHPELIKNINNPSEKVQLAVVKKDDWALRYLNNPSEAAQIAAVQQVGGRSLQHIKNPSERVQLAAVTKNGEAIKFINNPSEKVQLAAVKNDPEAIEYIENPSEELLQYAIQHGAVSVIKHIDNPSEEMQLAAVKGNYEALRYIIAKGIRPSEAVQLAAVEYDGYVIRFIIKAGIRPSEEVQLAAVQENGYVIQHIKNPSEKVQLAAVTENGESIEYIENPSEAVQMAAVENDPEAIKYIKNPYQSVIKYVNEKEEEYEIPF